MDGKKGIRSKNKDRVSVIGGYEGMGKSNLLLQMWSYWTNDLLGVTITKDHIVYIGDNKETFASALKSADKYWMVTHDEAVRDLYGRKAMSNFNTSLNQMYAVIRGRNLHTILVIPSILDLDSFFRRRRVTTYYHVYEEGKVAVFFGDTLRRLIPAMQRMAESNAHPDPMKAKDKDGWPIRPDFFDSFGLYKGILLEPYLERKEKNMEETIEDTFDSGEEKKEVSLKDVYYEEVVEMLNKTDLSMNEIGKKMKLNPRLISSIRAEAKKNGEVS